MCNTNFFERDIVNDYSKYENELYKKYQQMADNKLKSDIQELLSSPFFLEVLKRAAGKSGFKFKECRDIKITLGSGQRIKIKSPVFIKMKPSERKKGRKRKRKKVTEHSAIKFLGFIKHKSPSFVSLCVQASIICPSFDIAEKFLLDRNIKVSQGLLQRITYSLGDVAMENRTTVTLDERNKKTGLRILICIDGGRIRERKKKRGKRNYGLKRQGFTTDWKEPKLFTVHVVDSAGKITRDYKPVYDGTLENADGMFRLLEEYLRQFNLAEAQSITFCCDGGAWIWNRIPRLAKNLNITAYNEVLDYTHAKQNLRNILDIVQANKGTTKQRYDRDFSKLKNMLWNGDIDRIKNYIDDNLKKKRAKQEALKKLNSYFGDHNKFQYSRFRANGIPIGSGTVESAIRRVLNLRIKSPGIFWKKENAEKMIFLRSQLLSGRWNIMMKNIKDTTLKNLNLLDLQEYKNVA